MPVSICNNALLVLFTECLGVVNRGGRQTPRRGPRQLWPWFCAAVAMASCVEKSCMYPTCSDWLVQFENSCVNEELDVAKKVSPYTTPHEVLVSRDFLIARNNAGKVTFRLKLRT